MRLLKNNVGFTLIELLIVVSLIAIVAGVSTDIILTLVRSYSKTRITNEIDQSANAALLKIEKELRTATSLETPSTIGTTGTTRTLVFVTELNGIQKEVTYQINQSTGGLYRTETNLDGTGLETFPLIDPSLGVKITNVDVFTLISQNPSVVHIRLVFEDTDTSGQPIFDGQIEIVQNVIMRGTY